MSEENFCSTCGFDKHITNALKDMRNEKDFSDVTLACGNNQILAHKVILAAYSPFFRNILIRNPHPHPLIYLKCANYKDLQAILNYLYLGQVDVPLENVKSFLALAKDLEIKGMDKALNSLDETTADDIATGSKVYEKVPRPQPSTNKRPPQESSSKQKTPQPSRIEKPPHRSRPPGQMEQKVAGMRSRSPSPAPKLPPSKYIRTSATGSPPLRNEDDHLNDKDLNNQSEFTSPSGVKQGHVESKDGPKDVKDDEILNWSVDNPRVQGGQGQPAGAPGGPVGPGGPASLEDEYQDHVEFPSSPPDNRDGGFRERGNNDFFDGAGFEGQDKFFGRSGGQDGFCRDLVGHGRGRSGFVGSQDFDEGFGGREGGFREGSPGFGRAEIGGRGGFRGRGGHDGTFKERGSVGFGGPGHESMDDPKDVKDDENPNGSNPGGPGGQDRPGGAPGGPGGPPSPPGLFGDFQPSRGNRGSGSRERGNNDFFNGAEPGDQDGFFRGPGGHGSFVDPQDFGEGFGGRGGGFREGSPEFVPSRGKGCGGFGGPGIGTQEKDSDVTNAQDQAPEVMNTEDLDAQNDEDLQSTIASQSESSTAGSSDVDTVGSYGDAKEEIQRLKKFVTDNLEVSNNTFVCKICSKTYDRRWNIERHIQTIHFGEEKVCRQCGQFFKHPGTLAEHYRRGSCKLPSFR